jgi:hypothetical protein
MTLLDIHVELAETNRILARVADALERLSPAIAQADHSAHPLVGISDVSHFTQHSDSERDTMAIRASDRVRFSNRPGGAAAGVGKETESIPISRTGQWDHEDPLDNFPELDREWPNHPGADA